MDTALSERLHSELLAGRIGAEEPGAVLAVYRDGEMIASACRGVTDVDAPEQLSENTLLNIASVSKQIAATTILLAAKHGSVDLDEDIRRWLPELQLPGITLRNCLNHTAGLPDYFAVAFVAGISVVKSVELDGFTTWLGTVTTPDFLPGTSQAYSNSGYVAAALATERATGVEFPTLIEATVLRPLGMTRSFAASKVGETRPGMAMSFSKKPDGSFVQVPMGVGTEPVVRSVFGDGEIVSCLADFGKWQGFLRDGRALGLDIRNQLIERTVLPDGRPSSYALGIENERRGDTFVQSHSGGMWGYTAFSLVDQMTGISVACFSNRGDFMSPEYAWRAYQLATSNAGVSGRWFSEQSFHGVQLDGLVDGSLQIKLHSSAPGTTLRRLSKTAWSRDGGFAAVELIDGRLYIASMFELKMPYTRVDAPGPLPEGTIGSYTEPTWQAELKIEQRETGLMLVLADGNELGITPWGQTDEVWLGETSFGLLVVDREGGGVRYTRGSFAAELTRAKR